MDVIWDSIEWEWSDHPDPDTRAIALATDLLKATKKADVFPQMASSGRFPTVRLLWQDGRVEVEVFPKRFELYHLPEFDETEASTISDFETNSLPELIEKIKDALSRKSSQS